MIIIKRKKQTIPALLKKAQIVFNRWIRQRDEDDPCISCGKFHDEGYDAGHYVPLGSSSFLRFNEDNTHKEGKGCNGFDKFHLIGYRKNLINKIGIERVEWLEENRRLVKRWTRDELIRIIEKYKIS